MALDVTFTMVTNAAALAAVTEGPDGMLAGMTAGKFHIDISTVSPDVSRALAAKVRDKGADTSENQAVGLVSKVLYDLGSEYVEAVNTISGERCNPHPHVFSDRVLRPGDPVYYDILHSEFQT